MFWRKDSLIVASRFTYTYDKLNIKEMNMDGVGVALGSGNIIGMTIYLSFVVVV
jgi:hypothetical protein